MIGEEAKPESNSISPNIITFKDIVNTPAFPYIIEEYHLLLRDSLAEDAAYPNWEDNAIVAILDDAPVGVIIWCKNDWSKIITIRLGWVSPGFRRKGIYRKLWNSLVAIAREEKVSIIDGYTSVKNINMQAAMQRLGREPFAIGYRYRIKS